MREQILTSLQTLLQGITIANGYDLDVKAVRRYNDLEEISSRNLPALLLLDENDEIREHRTGGVTDIYLPIDIVGVVSSRENFSRDANDLDKQIKKALYSEPTLSGIVAHVKVDERIDNDLSGNEIMATFTRQGTVFYVGQNSDGD